MNEVTFEILEHIRVISRREIIDSMPWSKEINIVAWNGHAPKVDIRDWDADHERMTRGITLFEDEAKALANALTEYFNKKEQSK